MFGYKLVLERIEALKRRIDACEGHECPDRDRIEDIERRCKVLDRDMDDIEAYVKKVLGRVTGGERRTEKDKAGNGPLAAQLPDDINERIQEGLPI